MAKKDNLVKLAKGNKETPIAPAVKEEVKVPEKVLTPEEERDLKTKAKVDELLDGIKLTSDTEEKKEEFHDIHAIKRPKRLKAEIHRFQNNLEKWIAVVGIKDGRPYEIFTGKFENGLSNLPNTVKDCEVVKNIIDGIDIDGKPSKIKRYDIEYIDLNGVKQTHMGLNHAFNPEFWNYAKLISGIMRHGMPIIKQFELVDSLNFKEDYINTWKNGVARIIKRYVKDGEKSKGNCPECGGTDFVFAEGCIRCVKCSWSKCS